MAWWNPLDWAADATVNAFEDGLNSIAEKVKENPNIVLVPAGAVIGGAALAQGAVSFTKAFSDQVGRRMGRHYADEVEL